MSMKEPSLRRNPNRGRESREPSARGEIALTIHEAAADEVHRATELLRQTLSIPESPAIQKNAEGNIHVSFQLTRPRTIRSRLVPDPEGEAEFQKYLLSLGKEISTSERATLNALGYARSQFALVDTAEEMRRGMHRLLQTDDFFKEKVAVRSFTVPYGSSTDQVRDFSADFNASSTESSETPAS